MEVYVKEGDEYKPLSSDFAVLSKSDLTSKYVTKDEQKDAIEAAVQSRFKNHVHRDKVFEDEVLLARFKEQFGSDKADVDIDARRKQWETAHLRPVQEELETVRSQMESVTGRLKYKEMRDTLGGVFDDTFVERIDPSRPSLAEVVLGDQVEFDVETSTVRLKGSSMSLAEYAKELAADEKYKRFRREPERNTTDANVKQDSVSSGGGGEVRRSQMTEEQKQAYRDKYGWTVPKVEGKPAYMQLRQ